MDIKEIAEFNESIEKAVFAQLYFLDEDEKPKTVELGVSSWTPDEARAQLDIRESNIVVTRRIDGLEGFEVPLDRLGAVLTRGLTLEIKDRWVTIGKRLRHFSSPEE